jgi:hypothetical protein
MTEADYLAAWEGRRLVRALALPADLPPATAHWLRAVGLPAEVQFAHPTTPTLMTFARLATGVVTLQSEVSGEDVPSGWDDLLIIGEDEIPNGSAALCVHQVSGEVVRVDPELEDAVRHLNASVPHFALCLVAAVKWSSGRSDVDELRATLNRIDPDALASDGHYWPFVLDEVSYQGRDRFKIVAR